MSGKATPTPGKATPTPGKATPTVEQEDINEYDEEEEQNYETIPFTEEPVCYSIDPAFCKLTFALKHALYSETILTGDEQSDKQQDLQILNQYMLLLDIIHSLLYGLFKNQMSPESPIPKEIIEALPPASKKALLILYPTICQAIKTNQKNNNIENNEVYGLFIHNIFHTYPYEMSTDDPERD